jgi:hypothetical protein
MEQGLSSSRDISAIQLTGLTGHSVYVVLDKADVGTNVWDALVGLLSQLIQDFHGSACIIVFINSYFQKIHLSGSDFFLCFAFS